MAVNVFFAAGADLWGDYAGPLAAALAKAGVDATLSDSAPDPARVDYMVFAPTGIVSDFTPYTGTKAVLNLWAGVERLVVNPTLTQPLCRMVDHSLTESMTEWVVGHTLRHHLGMDRYITQEGTDWTPVIPPLARDRKVTVLGMGELGTAAAQALAALNFPVTGWSRTPKQVEGVRCLSGAAGLEALSGAAVVVTLLPKNPGTENTLNARTLGLLAEGAFVLNPGRGPLIDDTALLAALDSGRVAHATLDVFRVEPLPAEHPFWAHPRVTVTPHIAADTRTDSAAEVIAENVRRGEAGEPFLHLVDRTQGY